MQLPIKKTQLELKKHINAIHCSNNLSLVQRKLFNTLLFFAYPELSKQSKFSVPIKTLCDSIGFNSRNYALLKKALHGLTSIAIEWNIIENTSSQEKQVEEWQTSAMLASAKLKEGICTYEYSSVMKELLFQPEMYGRIHIPTVSKFTSSYGLALYENCIRYQNLPQTPWFSVATFRKLMGVQPDKYTTFNNFKRRVLDIAVDEVNKHAQINVSTELERHGKKVANIRFKLTGKQNEAVLVPALCDGGNTLLDTLVKDFCLSTTTATQIIEQYGNDYVREKMLLIKKSRAFQSGKIKALSGYLIDAVKKDYKHTKSSTELLQEQRVLLQKKQLEDAKESEHQRKMESLYLEYRTNEADDFMYEQSPENRDQIIRNFEAYLEKHPPVFNLYCKYALDNQATKAYFNGFVSKIMMEQGRVVMEYEEFVEDIAKQ